MAFITIDPYYTTQFYNECLAALKNNSIDYREYINIKPPYNWYLEIEETPILVNYDLATDSESRWMVNTVKPLRPSDEYLLLRRENDKGASALLKFIENEPLKKARLSKYAVFFNVQSYENALSISKEYPGRIWYLGKYYNNKYRVCLALNETIKAFINDSDIILEKENNTPGQFEADLNFKVFRKFDRLIKFTETPYFEDGNFKRVNIRGEYSSRFNL